MLDNDLKHRIKRIYTAVGAVEEHDIGKFEPKVIQDSHRSGFYQDWRGDLTDEELSNIAYSLIHNIANLQGHLKKWADHNGQDKTKVDDAFNSYQDLQIIQDLSNNDKHGYPPRNGGHSGKSPRIEEFNCVLQMAIDPQKGSSMRLTFDLQGKPQIGGSGTAKVIITGSVLDGNGNMIGQLYEIAIKAIECWEKLLNDFGIK